MPWDLVCFHESAARNGLAGIAVPAGEDYYKVSGDDLFVRGAGVINMAGFITAAIANYDEGRFHHTRDPNWNHSRVFVRDQTGAVDYSRTCFLAYPFNAGDILRAEADNANNAQIENCYLALVYGEAPGLRIIPPQLPIGTRLVNLVGATTVTANTWSTASMTHNYEYNTNKLYQVLGMIAYSATGYAARMKYKGSSPWASWCPGVPCGDTNILNQMLYGNFGVFKGDQPPDVSFLCSAGDTAQYASLLIVEQ